MAGWPSGAGEAVLPPVSPGAVAPPPADVRREMLRMEVAALEVEIQARLAEAAALVPDTGDPASAPGPGDEASTAGEEPSEG